MFLRITTLLLLALLVAACGGGSDGGDSKSASTSSDECGGEPAVNEEIDGVPVVRHCGDATGTFTAGDVTIEVSGGQCQNTDESFVYNAGTTMLGGEQGSTEYLGILAGQHPAANSDAPVVGDDGTYDEGTTVTANGLGKNYALLNAKVTLTDDRTKGTFEGTDAISKATVTGEFSCG